MDFQGAFISYVEEDTEFARALGAELRSLGHATWTYEDDGIPGVSYLSQVDTAISACRVFVLIASDQSINAHQVIREVEQAHERRKVIIPVRLGITHEAFASANSVLRMAVGTAVSLSATVGQEKHAAARIAATIEFASQDGMKELSERHEQRSPQSRPTTLKPSQERDTPAARSTQSFDWLEVPWLRGGQLKRLTQAEVLRLVPGAVPGSQQQVAEDGSVELVRVPEARLMGHPFRVSYRFLDGSLIGYTLSLKAKPDSERFFSLYQQMADVLTHRYGVPSKKRNVRKIGNTELADTSWSTEEADFILFLQSDSKGSTVMVAFEKPE